MRSKNTASGFILLLIMLMLSTTVIAQLSKPSPISNAPSINGYVDKSFDLYDNTNAVKTRVDALQKEVMEKNASDIDMDKVSNELTYCSNTLSNLLPTATDLAASAVDMPGKAKEEMAGRLFTLPSALSHVKTATKAVTQSNNNIKEMLNTTIPAIKAKLKEKKGVDVDNPKTTDKTGKKVKTTQNAVASAGEMTTTLTVENIAYGEISSFVDKLKSASGVKSVSKAFNNNVATFTVNHTGTSEELMDYIMSTSYGKKATVQTLSQGVIKLKLK